jgi:hypothetical protein
VTADAASIRRFAAWALVAGLSLAAATAIIALLVGSFDDTELRVVLTSLGFAVCSSTGSAGAALRVRAGANLRALGTATLALSLAAFLLLLAGLWINMDEWGSEGVWRTFGCTAVLGFAGAHASLVLGARRGSDSPAIRALASFSVVLGALDAFGAIVPISGIADDIDEAWARLFAAGLVLLVLTSVLPAILRRMQPAPTGEPAPAARGPVPAGAGQALAFLAAEVVSTADRIEELNRGPGIRAPEIRVEVERLRNLARAFER